MPNAWKLQASDEWYETSDQEGVPQVHSPTETRGADAISEPTIGDVLERRTLTINVLEAHR